MSVHYTVELTNPDAHLLDVQLDIGRPDPEGQLLRLPNWIPGSYMIRDFSRHIVSIEASVDGEPTPLEPMGKSAWRSLPKLPSLRIRMRVYGFDRSVRAAHIDRNHAFFNGTSVFLQVDGQESERHRVSLPRPSLSAAAGWQLATTLKAVDIDADGFGLREAANYDELIDHPVEMGSMQSLDFAAANVPHRMVVSGCVDFSATRLQKDLARICEWIVDFWGRPAPVVQYLFMTTIVGSGYGGLEHRSSTALLANPEHLPGPGSPVGTKRHANYVQFLGLCSHEYFHTWNVKRLKPARFIPLDMQREVHTELLWFFEGITSYYDDIALVRSGIIDHETYLDLLAKTLTRVQRGPGQAIQSVAASSHDAWTKFYKQDENSPNSIVSYYAKGALFALCLDAEIRRASDNQRSLDNLMRALWQRWLDNPQTGVAEREPDALASELAGVDLRAFFDAHLRGTDALPLVEAFDYFGVELCWDTQRSSKDNGSVRQPVNSDQDVGERRRPVWLGATLESRGTGVLVRSVLNGSPAEQAGLAGGDVLLTINAQLVTEGKLQRLLDRLAWRDSAEVHYLRNDVLQSGCLPIATGPEDTARLAIVASDSIANWLGVATPSA